MVNILTSANVQAEVLQGSILWPLLLLIYINHLSNNLNSNPKLFANDISLYSVINDKHLSANKLNQDLNRMNYWAFEGKMSFNPDRSK